MQCCSFGLHWLPISVVILLPGTFLVTYIIAVLLNHVEPGFPYISDTGAQSPESCIFGQFLNIIAVLAGLTIYVRYKQVEDHCQDHSRLLRLNKVTLVLGLIASLGMSIVGNFQETNVLVVHVIGAMMAFGVGTVYCWIHSYMSLHMVPHVNTKCTMYIRFAACVTMTLTFVSTFVCAGVSFRMKSPDLDPAKWKPEDAGFSKHLYHGNNPRKWFPEDGGYAWHVVSTASEWTMVAGMLVFFATFIQEFRTLALRGLSIEIMIDNPPLRSRGEYQSVADG